jgi:GNAT superfamily N-acetyltransferase
MERDNINIEYRFDSALGVIEEYRYINSYKVDIYSDDDAAEPVIHELIGKVEVSLVLLNLLTNKGMDFFPIFDTSQFLVELGQTIIDYDTNELREPLVDEVMTQSGNILVIERFELLPEWRKRNIGKKVIKDIVLRFSGCCDLVMLKAFPLQQEYQYAEDKKSDWDQKMQFLDLPKDEEFSNFKVFAYYQKMGFAQLGNTDYFYLNMSINNAVFDAIDLEE